VVLDQDKVVKKFIEGYEKNPNDENPFGVDGIEMEDKIA